MTGARWFNAEGLPEKARAAAAAGEPLRFGEELAGSVVLVDFWDYSCVNCVRTLPYLKEWWDRYHEDGFVLLGVHTPEFEFGKDPKNVQAAIIQFALDYPIVSDPDYITWKDYDNDVWPRELLVDVNGVIQHDHRGEGGYEKTEAKIQELLTAIAPEKTFGAVVEPVRETDKPGAVCYPTTPEIYCGFERGAIASPEGLPPNQATKYTLPAELELGAWAVEGLWAPQAEELVHAEAGVGRLLLQYEATEVYAVMRSLDGSPVTVTVLQDGQPVGADVRGDDVGGAAGASVVTVGEDRLYTVVQNKEHGSHLLELQTDSDQLAVHTFTFGTSCEE